MAGRGSAVFRSWRPPGAGFAGFRCTGWLGRRRADVPKPPADARWGQPPWRGGSFPGAAQVSGERPGEPQLGMAADDQPGPPVSSLGVADLRDGPPEDLFEQAEGVLQVEPAQEPLPQTVRVIWGGAGAGEP